MTRGGEIQIYSYRRCPFAIRVRMTLHEKNLSFNTYEEDLKNHSVQLLEHHPEAKVPVLVHGDKALYESAVITEYLEDQFPEPRLMPKDSAERADVRLWTYWCNQIFKPHLDAFKYGESRSPKEKVEAAPAQLSKDLAKLESRLKVKAWLVGDAFSLADIHVFPFYRQLSRVNPAHPDIEKNSATNQWLEKIMARSAFEKTMKKIE